VLAAMSVPRPSAGVDGLGAGSAGEDWLGGRGRYRDRVGFNPFRSQAKRGTDVVIVVVALVVVAALVLWAVFG
jgi:hypothetical protein